MTESEKAHLGILFAYQAWCGERVVTVARATSIIDEASTILTTAGSKHEATQRFVDADWGDTQCSCKSLVAAIWPFRESLIDSAIAGREKSP
jgi:hypothetical protein